MSITADETVAALFGDGWPRNDLELALREIPDALPAYDHAKEYDDINLWERFRLDREGRTLRQAGIEFEPNYCSPVIDAVNNRLLISAWTATAGDAEDSAASAAATDALAKIVRYNEMHARYRSWNRNTLRDGDGYLMVWPVHAASATAHPELTGDVDPTDGTVTADAGPAQAISITYHDPRCGRMFYDPENPQIKLFYAYLWETKLAGEKQERLRINLVYDDRIEKWISNPGKQAGKAEAKDFQPYLDPDADDDNDYPDAGDTDDDAAPAAMWPMPNPYGMLPVFHLRNGFEYGTPEHANAFGPQDSISTLVEIMMVAVEFNGYPQRYAIQEADSLGNQSIREDPLADHSPAAWDRDTADSPLIDAVVTTDAISNETGSEYEANPGAMMLLKGFKDVGSFTVADPNVFLDPIRQNVTAIATTTSTPLWKFRGTGATPPSGAAFRMDESDLVQKANDRMVLLGAAYEAACECALLMLGIAAQVRVSWANPATNDLIDVWELVEQKVKLGVPREVALMQAGVPEAQAAEWAKTYSDTFAEGAMQQAKALEATARAQLFAQQAIAAKIANGVPERVALIEAGNSAADVDAWLAEQSIERTLGRKVTLLVQIGEAIQAIGAGVNMGVLDAGAANAVVANVLGDLIPEVPQDELLLDEEDVEEEPPGAVPPALLPYVGGGALPQPPVAPDPQDTPDGAADDALPADGQDG